MALGGAGFREGHNQFFLEMLGKGNKELHMSLKYMREA